MHKDWPELAAGFSDPLRALRAGAPDVMKGFSAVARAALEAKALDTKTKELIALADFRGDAVRRVCRVPRGSRRPARRHPRRRSLETMGMAIYMGAGPSVMYAAQALEAFDQSSHGQEAVTVSN